MGWTDRFWSASNWVLDNTIHAVADTANMVGTLACSLGGVGFATSEELAKREVTASYFGGINTVGDIGFNVSTNMGITFNDTIPVVYNHQVNSGTSYSLASYINSSFFASASFVCVGSGICLKTLGANINKWQQSREERRSFESSRAITIANPRAKEYLFVSLEAINSSLANAFLSHSIAASIFYCYGKIFPNITYPFDSDEMVNGSYYNGPVIITPFSFQMAIDPASFSVNVSVFKVDGWINSTVKAIGNITYGGGFFFKRKVEEAAKTLSITATELISTSIGVSAYLLSNFFAKKHKINYEERRENEEKKLYSPVAILEIN